jgi:hypothetical protein
VLVVAACDRLTLNRTTDLEHLTAERSLLSDTTGVTSEVSQVPTALSLVQPF